MVELTENGIKTLVVLIDGAQQTTVELEAKRLDAHNIFV